MAAHDSSSAWAETVVSEAKTTSNLTLGLISGSRKPNDRRLIDRLIVELSRQAQANAGEYRLLLVRLQVHVSKLLDRGEGQSETIPAATKSPLGDFSEIEVPIPVGARASWALTQMPQWLGVWKDAYRLVAIDLGPVDLVPSRILGRICDVNYLLLGPETCGSSDWLMEHMAWHDKCRSTICGTLVSEFEAAA